MAILSMKLIKQFYHNLSSIVLFLPNWELWIVQMGQYVKLIYQFKWYDLKFCRDTQPIYCYIWSSKTRSQLSILFIMFAPTTKCGDSFPPSSIRPCAQRITHQCDHFFLLEAVLMFNIRKRNMIRQGHLNDIGHLRVAQVMDWFHLPGFHYLTQN